MKPTLVIGASTNPERYSYKAMNMLLDHGHTVYGYGIKSGNVNGIEFSTEMIHLNIDTVTMYIGSTNQSNEIKDYIISLHPKRVIFNPGTENPEFSSHLNQLNIESEDACTLVLLQTGQY